MMKVLLVKEVETLGHPGDVVSVKDGYARNFLIPNHLARIATPANLKLASAMKKKAEEALRRKKEEALRTAEALSALALAIPMAAGEEEKLFGSVTADIIAETLASRGFSIDKKQIVLAEPIKRLGSYQVEVKIPPEQKATLAISIVKA